MRDPPRNVDDISKTSSNKSAKIQTSFTQKNPSIITSPVFPVFPPDDYLFYFPAPGHQNGKINFKGAYFSQNRRLFLLPSSQTGMGKTGCHENVGNSWSPLKFNNQWQSFAGIPISGQAEGSPLSPFPKFQFFRPLSGIILLIYIFRKESVPVSLVESLWR
ncbi:hypothetical protein CDAR_619401 [Caerostris darwini]|uniref:Uncharacterized protein n=1 Tax=Caerostris darwini TaxID=1538125 RepID=A0AAV4PSG4_9ARAC|nr:hypothetical protein CDAR_619401 [Caerostris darwini]